AIVSSSSLNWSSTKDLSNWKFTSSKSKVATGQPLFSFGPGSLGHSSSMSGIPSPSVSGQPSNSGSPATSGQRSRLSGMPSPSVSFAPPTLNLNPTDVTKKSS